MTFLSVEVDDTNGVQYVYFASLSTLSISNSIGKYLIFGDVDSRCLNASVIAVIISSAN